MSSRAELLAQVSERTWQAVVVAEAKRRGWKVYSIHDSRTQEWGTDPGFPDLLMVRGERMLVVELKAQHGRLKPSQTAWRIALEGVPCVEWYAFKPADEARVFELLQW